MPETDDPRKALASDDVTVRTAGARDLKASGTFEDVEPLLAMAKADKNPSARLYAAASAAEIVIRSELSDGQRRWLLDELVNYDPANNPSLSMVLAGIMDPEGLERLGRLMRDPRSDVRAGACTALRMMSKHPKAEVVLPDAVRRWLLAGKHPDDATAELVRLASEAGFSSMDEALTKAAKRGRAAALAVQEALDWLVSRRDPTSWAGMWLSLGDDATVTDWLWLERGSVWGESGLLGELTVSDGVGSVQSIPPLHRIRLGRASDEGLTEAIRIGDRTLWHHAGRALVKLIDELDTAVLRSCVPAALGIAKEIASLEGASATRARVIALWRGGALREAEAVLDSAIAGEKRIKPEIQWLIANVKLGLGEIDTARDMLRDCLQGAPKKAAWRGEAEVLLSRLLP